MKRVLQLRFILPIATLLLINSCALQTKVPPEPKRLTIIGTGDLQGHLDAGSRTVRIPGTDKKETVAGGIGRLAAMIKDIEQESDHPVIVVSSGDDLMGRYFHRFHGKAIFSLMKAGGYQILALGNHEFDSGPGVLAQALESVDLPALCSDLEVSKTVLENHCQPYLLREYQGLKIGFFSLMTEEFPLVTLPGKVRLRDSNIRSADNMVRLLRKQGAEVIIAVTHIGTRQDVAVASQVPGIDIIFGGHSHNYEQELKEVNQSLIVNGGEKGPALVRLDVSLDKNNRVVPSSAHYQLLPVREFIRPDPNVEELLADYHSQLPAATVIGKTTTEWDLTTGILRYRESTVADMICDMIRKRFKTDVVLYNSGAFRGNAKYPPGPVTDVMVSDIDEFETTVFLLDLQGKYLADILEHSAAQIGQGGFLQVSGIRFTIDTNKQPQRLSSETASQSAITQAGKRVSNIQVLSAQGKWEPLDPDRTYRVAANDFLVKRSGNHYFWFKKYGRNIRNTYSTMGSLLTDFFRNRKVAGPGRPDGRIHIK